MASNCLSNCNRSSRNELDIKCAGFCNKQFHKKCLLFSDYEVDMIRKDCGIKYVCEDCSIKFNIIIRDFEKISNLITNSEKNTIEIINNKLNKILDCVNKFNNNVKNEIKNTLCDKTKQNKTISYAESLKLPVIIKPKNNKKNEDSSVTKKEIKNVLLPSTVSAEIKNVKDLKNSGIIINCGNKESAQKIKNKLSEKLGDKYDVFTPNTKNPCLLVVGIMDCLSKENVCKAIKSQNNIHFQELKCHKVYESYKKKGSYNAIIETDGEAFNKIYSEHESKINIEWNRCVVYEYFNKTRCFKCWGYNHKAQKCTTGSCCYKCGNLNHISNECTATKKNLCELQTC